ncbi:MAG: hypothetical protein BWK76_10025 [Desulfobulbaceae bacterium A2]|nr:MAG: hypothetical protein BWK76_10025 [Desulfobulbaceae bacterium A2]
MKRLAFGIVVALLVCYSSGATAFNLSYSYSGNPLRWWSPGVGFYLNASGNNAVLYAIFSSMATWNSAGANFYLTAYGISDSSSHGELDGVNYIDVGPLDYGVLGETSVWYDVGSGRIYDTDVRLNWNLAWATDGNANAYDVQSVVTHELGHVLYLGDLYNRNDADKTMYGYGSPGNIGPRSLHADDIAGIRTLYGQ